MNTELTDDQLNSIPFFGGLSDHALRRFARAVIAADRALQDARHREELAAYEMTVANLRADQPCDGCGETCKRAKLCATCAGEIAAALQPAAQPTTLDAVLDAARLVLSNKRGDDDWLILSVHAAQLEDAIAAHEAKKGGAA